MKIRKVPLILLEAISGYNFCQAENLAAFFETPIEAMQSNSPTRVSKVAIATSIVLVLLAMMLPVCHLHPLLDKTAPDHCTICITLHAALPMGAHAPVVVRLSQTGEVRVSSVTTQSNPVVHFTASRAPPLPVC